MTGAAYWSCPMCPAVVGLGWRDVNRILGGHSEDELWEYVPSMLLLALEHSVEAHEVKHMERAA